MELVTKENFHSSNHGRLPVLLLEQVSVLRKAQLPLPLTFQRKTRIDDFSELKIILVLGPVQVMSFRELFVKKKKIINKLRTLKFWLSFFSNKTFDQKKEMASEIEKSTTSRRIEVERKFAKNHQTNSSYKFVKGLFARHDSDACSPDIAENRPRCQ